MTKKIKVAQMIGSVCEGGVESCIMNYFKAIDTKEVQFDFFVDRASKIIDQKKIEELGGRVIVTPHYTHLFSYLKFLRSMFRQEGYDVVHANMTALNFLPLSVAKRAGVPMRIAHAHSTSNGEEKLHDAVKTLLKPFAKVGATTLFACSEKAGRWLFGDKTFESGEVTIINNAVDLHRFAYSEEKRAQVRKELGLKEDAFVIGHIGRFCAQKNHKFLLDAFRLVAQKNPEARLLLVGEGPLFEETIALSKELGIEEKVLFLGSVKNPEDYYSAMDLFALPSLYEGLPVVAVEAQTNGLQCLFSTEVTREAKLLESTDYLALSDGAEVWAKRMENPSVLDRTEGLRVMSTTIYSIHSEAKKLLAKYKEGSRK